MRPVRRGGADAAAHRGRPRAGRRRVAQQPAGVLRRPAGRPPRSSASAGCCAGSATARAASSAARRSGASWSRAPPAGPRPASSSTGQEWDRLHRDAGLLPPKSEHPLPYESMLYDEADGSRIEVGYCTSFVYSPDAPAPRRPGPRATRPARRARHRPAARDRPAAPQHHGRRTHHEAAVLQPGAGRRAPHEQRLRRDRRRRRPQRADPRGVPRQGRPAHAGAGEERPRRRRRDHRGADARLLVHDVLLRAEPAAARDHPRARPGAARLHAADDAVVLPPDRRRRLPALRRRPRAEHPGDPAPLRRTTRTPTTATTTTSTGSARRSGRSSTTRRPTSSARTPRTRPT